MRKQSLSYTKQFLFFLSFSVAPYFQLKKLVLFLFNLNRIGKADSPLCLCGLTETCSHLLFDCPVYCRARVVIEFELSEYEISVPFPLSLINRNNRVRTSVNRFLSRTKRLDFQLVFMFCFRQCVLFFSFFSFSSVFLLFLFL